MKVFTPGKRIHRVVTIRSNDRALLPGQWVLGFAEDGLTVRRYGTKETMKISWRSVVGHTLIHRGA